MKAKALLGGLACLVAATSGCKEVKTRLVVQPVDGSLSTGLVLVNTKGQSFSIPPGSYEARISLASREGKKTVLSLKNVAGHPSSKPLEAELALPTGRQLLSALDPVEIDGQRSGQPFTTLLTREVEAEGDHYSLTLLDTDHPDQVLATAEFYAKGAAPAFDGSTGTFLRSYQAVARSQRGAVFVVNAELDGGRTKVGKAMADALDFTVNWGGKLLVAPWVHARYAKVRWLLGDDGGFRASDKQRKAWVDVLASSPVVDYFSFVHSGDQRSVAAPLEDLPIREHQLRLIYSSACYGKSNSEFIDKHGFAVAAGHPGLSASPVMEMSFVRWWAYGRDVKTALNISWERMKAILRTAEYVSFAPLWQKKTGFLYWRSVDDMLDSTRPMMSFTREMRPEHLKIGISAAPVRLSEEDRMIFEASIDSYKDGGGTPLRAMEQPEYKRELPDAPSLP